MRLPILLATALLLAGCAAPEESAEPGACPEGAQANSSDEGSTHETLRCGLDDEDVYVADASHG